MSLPTDSSRCPSGSLAALAILVVGVLCYGVGLDVAELTKEEARRAIPAREMLASGEFVVPTVWQRTYVAKPPLMFWTIAAVGAVRGQVDELAARLPSVCATLLTALGLFAFARRVLGARTGCVAALMMLVSPGAFEKGALGELEASLAMYVFASSAFLWLALEDAATRFARVAFTLLASIALAAAAMTKGPVALLFYGAALVGVVGARRAPRLLLRSVCWLPALVALAALGTWAAMVMHRVDSAHALGVWTAEIARAKDLGVGRYFSDRQQVIVGVIAAFFPGSWLCLVALFGRGRGAARAITPALATTNEAEVVRYFAIALVVSLVFFLLQPGVRTRFCYPALPWCVIVGSHVLLRSLALASNEQRSIRALLGVVVLAGVALVVGGMALHVTSIEGIESFDLIGHALLVVIVLAVIWIVRHLRRPVTRALLIAPLVMFVAGRLVHTTQLIPQLEVGLPKHTFGSEIDRLVPEGEAIDLRFWFGFNELSYTARRLVHAEPDVPIGRHRFLLALASQVESLRANTERELVERAKLRLIRGTEVHLIEIR